MLPNECRVANLFPLKAKNGLYYYALDYLDSIGGFTHILCRSSMTGELAKRFPGVDVIEVNAVYACIQIYRFALRGATIYCPTPHPLPFISRQMVVVHDLFPFQVGNLHDFKFYLFWISLKSSSCLVGYINKSSCLPFLKKNVKISDRRLLYVPNNVEKAVVGIESFEPGQGEPFQIGLLGTDSPKKRYEVLFLAVRQSGQQRDFIFNIYGFPTPYIKDLFDRFPDINKRLIDSGSCSITEFITICHALVSLSREEGFGRPFACGVSCGIPTFMPRCLLQEEFYKNYVTVFENVEELPGLLRLELQKPSKRLGEEFHSAINAAFQAAVEKMKATPLFGS